MDIYDDLNETEWDNRERIRHELHENMEHYWRLLVRRDRLMGKCTDWSTLMEFSDYADAVKSAMKGVL